MNVNNKTNVVTNDICQYAENHQQTIINHAFDNYEQEIGIYNYLYQGLEPEFMPKCYVVPNHEKLDTNRKKKNVVFERVLKHTHKFSYWDIQGRVYNQLIIL